MRSTGVLACVLGTMLLGQGARADSFGEWQFSPPDGYDHEVTTTGMVYKGANGVFLFPPSMPARGRPLAVAAAGLVTGLTGVAASGQRSAGTFAPEAGGEATAIIATDSQRLYVVVVFLRDDRIAAALFIAASPDVAVEQEALLGTDFTPLGDGAATAVPPALPKSWPAPLADRAVTMRPRLSVAQAAAIGLDADHVPLPGGFSCFRTEKPRALSPEPDLTVDFRPGLTYAVAGSGRSGQGTWATGSNDTFDHIVTLTGTLEDEGYILLSHDTLGQNFRIDDPFAEDERPLECRQNGPATEALVQAMARIAVDAGSFACTGQDGARWRLLFANGTYRVPEGYGTLGLRAESYTGDDWTLAMEFGSGPLALYGGKAEADPSGLLTLTLSTEWRTGSLFYSSTETTVHATCTMKTPARPAPLYGLDPAPPAASPSGGLPEGLFRSFEGSYSYVGTMPNYILSEMLTVVAPGGRAYHGIALDDIGALPDCARSRPDGHAFCGEYRILGGRISLRDPGEPDWDEPEPLVVTADGFRIGDIDYARVVPMAAASLAGEWVGADFSGGGPGAGGGVGIYTDADVWWQFGMDGRFAWREASTTTTMISPDPVMGGAMGGGSSSSQDAGAGTYAFDGLWLTLTFYDGRAKRLTVLPTDGEDGAPAGLVIAGKTLKRG